MVNWLELIEEKEDQIVAGGNSFHVSTFEGKSKELLWE